MCGELPLRQPEPRAGIGSSPRVRGTRAGGQGENDERGSSPRVRGTRVLSVVRSVAGRFIPACAGNSRLVAPLGRRRSVHPRVCGELIRVRHLVAHGQRFIPACAGNSRPSWRRRPPPAVHPRVCGELPAHLSAAVKSAGSSPRVRGTRPSPRPPPPPPTVHPRVCGELSTRLMANQPRVGSSPRVRGTPGDSVVERGPRRFIPACAGNSGVFRMNFILLTVHPRVCGELNARRLVARQFAGSSPRVRGTREVVESIWRQRPVHPRVCGELGPTPAKPSPRVGSSPRVRGTRAPSWHRTPGYRFIPACAGNSWPCPLSPPSAPVHPRVCGELLRAVFRPRVIRRFIPGVCGELSSCAALVAAMVGSSPRVRGTRVAEHRPPAGERFIPACAGNSSATWRSSALRSVHPRVCGELHARGALELAHGGSSPRVRGTRTSRPPRCTGTTVHPRVCGELGFR